jgi:hypothetical protein
MVLMTRKTDLHPFGRAIRRIQNAENVRAENLDGVAEMARRGGYPADRRLVSSYMRNWRGPKGEGEERPRSTAPPEFIVALSRGGELTREQTLDLVESWLEILPEDRRESLMWLCAAIGEQGASSQAWREMLAFEADREADAAGEAEGEDGGASGGRAT